MLEMKSKNDREEVEEEKKEEEEEEEEEWERKWWVTNMMSLKGDVKEEKESYKNKNIREEKLKN
jgi:hypothetical protein